MFANKPPMQHPASTAWNTVAHFDDDPAAQQAVDHLSDQGFPVGKLGVVAAGIGLGALWGAVFGFVAHSATRGQRDFSSVRGLSAARYDLIARDGTAERARTMLGQEGLLSAAP
jgi:hypothetical protein